MNQNALEFRIADLRGLRNGKVLLQEGQHNGIASIRQG